MTARGRSGWWPCYVCGRFISDIENSGGRGGSWEPIGECPEHFYGGGVVYRLRRYCLYLDKDGKLGYVRVIKGEPDYLRPDVPGWHAADYMCYDCCKKVRDEFDDSSALGLTCDVLVRRCQRCSYSEDVDELAEG